MNRGFDLLGLFFHAPSLIDFYNLTRGEFSYASCRAFHIMHFTTLELTSRKCTKTPIHNNSCATYPVLPDCIVLVTHLTLAALFMRAASYNILESRASAPFCVWLSIHDTRSVRKTVTVTFIWIIVWISMRKLIEIWRMAVDRLVWFTRQLFGRSEDWKFHGKYNSVSHIFPSFTVVSFCDSCSNELVRIGIL